eukprot:2996932-Pyramimonas_sp.AAC.1
MQEREEGRRATAESGGKGGAWPAHAAGIAEGRGAAWLRSTLSSAPGGMSSGVRPATQSPTLQQLHDTQAAVEASGSAGGCGQSIPDAGRRSITRR